MRTLPVWYPSNAFSSKHLLPCEVLVVAVFGNARCDHEEPGSPTMSFIISRTHVATPRTWRAFIRPTFCPAQANSPKSIGRVSDRKDGANNRRMCERGGERGCGYIVATGIHRSIARTSRDRDDVSNLLVLIKKSHKVPPGRDIAAGVRYIITMIYRILRVAMRRTFAEAVKEDWKHLQA